MKNIFFKYQEVNKITNFRLANNNFNINFEKKGWLVYIFKYKEQVMYYNKIEGANSN